MAVGGNLHTYESGYWHLITTRDVDWFDPMLFRACDEFGIDYGSKSQALRKTLTAIVTAQDVRFDRLPIIAAPNGAIDLDTEPGTAPELIEWSHEHYTTRHVAIPYDPSAACPEWEAMLARMLEHPDRTDSDVQAMARFVQQWAGIALVGPLASEIRPLQKGMIIDGPSGTGKTTFAEVMRELFGHGHVISPRMDELGREFGREVLLDAQAIIADDAIGVRTVGDASTLKAIVTGEQMSINRKYQSHVTFRYRGPVLFTTNTLPNIPDETDAVYNRFVVIRMDRVFSAADQKKQLAGMKPLAYLRKKKELPGILNWAIRGFVEAYDQRSFDIPDEVANAAVVFRMKNDPVYAFVSECLTPAKRKAIPAPVASAMCVEYAHAQHMDMRMSLRRAASALEKTVREVHRGVRHEMQGSSRVVAAYAGVGLTDVGVAYWNAVRERGLASLEGYRSPTVATA